MTEAIACQGWLFTVVLPVVVVPEGTLWTASYDQDGQLVADPTPCNDCSYFIGHRYPMTDHTRTTAPVTLSHIHFFTLSGLVGFLAKHTLRTIDWDIWIPDNLRENFDRR